MGACAEMAGLDFGPVSVFICYAHADNDGKDPRTRWLDRLLQFLRPLVRNQSLSMFSDKNIEIGESWHWRIRTELDQARVAVLLVSPAFLASDYIARSEVPVLLKEATDRGLKILPIIISPCLYEETNFRYPDWKTGPHELSLGSLQAANPLSSTLVEMTEGEQNRVLLQVARQISSWLEEDRKRREEESEVAQQRAERQNVERSNELKSQIEEASVNEPNKHVFTGDKCELCGCSVEAVAAFHWYHCNRSSQPT
jgi:hypothetical protein